MLTLSNTLSFLRAPLALLFLVDDVRLRVAAILLAAFTDSIDGYLARRSKSTSRFGAVLDPVMDKFFVYFVLSILLFEQKILVWEALAMLSRDFFLCVFGIYLLIAAKWRGYVVKAIRWGKITTALQFLILLSLSMGLPFPWYTYLAFILFGALAFVELQVSLHQNLSR
jgi:CDP-diacylglycerol---glycerol-3-phosphate 3-phosphatidyltransferase